MDNKIRVILGALNQENDKVLLNEVYQLLKYGVEVRDDSVDAIQASWYVLTAEVAFERGYRALAKDCLEMFFRKSPPEDQFLGRGYLCQAQLHAPVSKKDTENLEVAVSYITRAINFARKTTRYHFLVYNASVIYWKFCRPFLTAGHRHHLSKSLHNIVKALDDIDDKDYEWRTKLLIALIECHIDAGRREDAINVAQVAASFTKSHIPDTFKDIFELQIVHRLADPQKLVKDAKLAINLNILYRMKRLRLTFEGKEVPQAGKTPVEQVDIDLGRLIKRILREEDSSAPSGRKSVTPGGSLTQEEQIKFLLELAVEQKSRIVQTLLLLSIDKDYGLNGGMSLKSERTEILKTLINNSGLNITQEDIIFLKPDENGMKYIADKLHIQLRAHEVELAMTIDNMKPQCDDCTLVSYGMVALPKFSSMPYFFTSNVRDLHQYSSEQFPFISKDLITSDKCFMCLQLADVLHQQ
ncbi:Cilia- and flagella-associated protein 46 [Trichoplax sp. H2]|nr:Cilia- and flagella-associated protein 46 [Trichoplax sp. H2]|eukprot:RDD36124.1 Cilia- and flagella-associated protein 46 [Trichoplax sp. H2]